jgi:hypothetical protein
MKRLAGKEARLQKESMVENSLSRPATWEAEEIQEKRGWGWFPPAPAEEWKLNTLIISVRGKKKQVFKRLAFYAQKIDKTLAEIAEGK